MADIVNTNQFRNGMHIEHRGAMWRIVEFQHVKPGKGGAFVRTKLKNLESGAVVDDTFRAGEKFPRVHTEVKSVQFLYDDGTEAHFMDEETYEQFGLPSDGHRGRARVHAARPRPVQILQVNGKPSGLQLPASVELAVAETEPGRQGRHGLERDEARDARDRSGRPGAALREHRGAHQGRSRARRATSRAPDAPTAVAPRSGA